MVGFCLDGNSGDIPVGGYCKCVVVDVVSGVGSIVAVVDR